MKRTIDLNTHKVTFDDCPEIHKRVFDRLLERYFLKHDAFCGDTIMQCDNPQIEAAPILAEIVDEVIKFEVEYK